jgi:hypothetical protein
MSNPLGDLYGKSLPAALALAGVLVGLWMYIVGPLMVLGVIVLGILSLACLFIGRAEIATKPKSARWMIEAWVFSPLAVAACVTSLAILALLRLDLSGFLTTQLGGAGLEAKKLDDVASILKGAVSGFFAIVLTKDLWEGKGPFSVATQFEAATRDASEKFSLTAPERVLDALMSEVAPHDGISGWGFSARGKRAKVIAEHPPN